MKVEYTQISIQALIREAQRDPQNCPPRVSASLDGPYPSGS